MMPSKKKKYNARFPAGRIKKIMQTDEEVGKVAQAVPVIISRTLELFVESLLTRATRITRQRNAKTLSPSHLKQCIQDEARFDFLRDLVKNIPDVSIAEERELQSGDSSPNSVSDPSPSTRRSEETSKTRSQADSQAKKRLDRLSKQANDTRIATDRPAKIPRLENSRPVDLTKRNEVSRPNFYQETLKDFEPPNSVIRYANPQPSTSSKSPTIKNIPGDTPCKSTKKLPKMYPLCIDLTTSVMKSPVTPVLNIDFTKNLEKPEFKLINSGLALPKMDDKIPQNFTVKALSRSASEEVRKVDLLGAGNLEIDDDYDT